MLDDSHSLSFFISALVATTIIGNYKQAFDHIKDIVKQYEYLDWQLFLDDEQKILSSILKQLISITVCSDTLSDVCFIFIKYVSYDVIIIF